MIKDSEIDTQKERIALVAMNSMNTNSTLLGCILHTLLEIKELLITEKKQ